MRRHERNLVGIIFCGFAGFFFLWSIYGAIAAWLAPRCASPTELGTWCLPIGFAGPFADVWANHSFANARIWTATNLILAAGVLAAFIHISFFQPPQLFAKRAFGVVVIAILIVLLRGYALNSYS